MPSRLSRLGRSGWHPVSHAIVRGLRAISDFETEMQLAHNNRVLAPGVDTVFFMTAVENGYV
ncbi:MAG TPA: hypothetical protein VID95_07090, partial [Candidatus Limnocylindrales bacterium]